jgi:amylosucrase
VEKALETGDREAMNQALRLDGMLHAFIFTLSGIPVLYSGDEIARLNDSSYHDDPLRREDSRYLHRGAMDWEKAEKRRKKTTPEGRMFAAVRQLEEIRGKHRVFDPKADVWVLDTGNEHVLGIGRYYCGEQLLALFNFLDQPQKVRPGDEKTYTDLISGKEGDAGTVRLEAGGFRWLLHQF